MAALTSEPRWAFGAGVGNGNASVLSRASMVDEPSTLKIELIYWPATTFAARAEAQAALFRDIDGWQKPRRIQQGLVGRSPDEYEAPWQARQRQPARLPSNARTPKSPARKDKSPGNRERGMRAWYDSPIGPEIPAALSSRPRSSSRISLMPAISPRQSGSL